MRYGYLVATLAAALAFLVSPVTIREGSKHLSSAAAFPGQALTATKKMEVFYANYPEAYVFAWSPDEKHIALSDRFSIFLFDLQTRQKVKTLYRNFVAPDGEDWISAMSWGKNNIIAVVTSVDVWLTTSFISADGSRLYAPIDGGDPSWLGQGEELVYSVTREDAIFPDIWWRNLKTGAEKELLISAGEPAVLDSRRFVYRRYRFWPASQEEGGIWLFGIDTGEDLRLTRDTEDRNPIPLWNEYVIFVRGSKKDQLWFYHIATGEEGELLSEECFDPAVSPSGRYLLCWTKAAEQDKYALTLLELQRQKRAQ